MNGYNHWGLNTKTTNWWDSQTSALKGPTELSVLYLSISRPCQASTLWGLSLAVCADHFLSQLIHNDLALQILHEERKKTPEIEQSVTAPK